MVAPRPGCSANNDERPPPTVAQGEALHAAESLGFTRLGRVYGNAIDQDDRLHDVVLLRRWRAASNF